MVNRDDAGLSEIKTLLAHCFLKLGCEHVVCFSGAPNSDREKLATFPDPGVEEHTRRHRERGPSLPLQLVLYCSAVIAGGL